MDSLNVAFVQAAFDFAASGRSRGGGGEGSAVRRFQSFARDPMYTIQMIVMASMWLMFSN